MVSYVILFTTAIFLCCPCIIESTYSDCGSVNGKIDNLQISNCDDNWKRCILKRNTNATLRLTFIPSSNVNDLKAVVHGIILGVPMPFNLPNDDACKDSGLNCPLEKGKSYIYTTSLPVYSTYPKVTVDVKWELKTKDEQEDVVCALIPSKIN